MIQRIQSIYLLLATVALSLTFVFPFSSYYGEMHTFNLNLLNIENLVPDTSLPFNEMVTYPLIVFIAAIIFISIISILRFKNRKLQMKMIKINILLNIFLIAGIFVIYSRFITNTVQVEEVYKTASFLPLVSLVMFVLAFRSVKKDDDLVKSADRLR